MAELRTRYPRSAALEALLYLSAEESHDHISTIQLSDSGIAVTFERRSPRGEPTYPACENLLSPLTEGYGKPSSVVDAQEERTRNRRFEWKATEELMTLVCFQLPRRPLYAERLAITARH